MTLVIAPGPYAGELFNQFGFLVEFQPIDTTDDTYRLTQGAQQVEVNLITLREVVGSPLIQNPDPQIAVLVIRDLINAEYLVIVRGLGPDEMAEQDDGTIARMGDHGVFLSPVRGQAWPPTVMNIWIDATWCRGSGYAVGLRDSSVAFL